MFKVVFIVLGITCLGVAAFQILRKNSFKTQNNSDKTIQVSKCSYCGDYVEKEPDFSNGSCEVCDRMRVCSKKR